MSIRGFLSDFSLPEILQFIERGRKTGLLTICTSTESPASENSVHYIWVEQGFIVAAANRLDQQGLMWLIEQHQRISNRVIAKLAQLCPRDKPLGQYLFNQGVLQAEQLKELFLLQVLQPVNALFQLKDGILNFDQNVRPPRLELTGLSILAGEPKLFANSLDALADVLMDETLASQPKSSFRAHLRKAKTQSLVSFLREQRKTRKLAFKV